jgi:hypothetical protein
VVCRAPVNYPAMSGREASLPGSGQLSGGDRCQHCHCQINLSFIIDYQRPDDARDPSAEGEEEDYEHGAAALIYYSQGRANYAYQDP